MAATKLLTLGCLLCLTVDTHSADDTTSGSDTGNYVDKIFVDKCSFPTHKTWTDEQKESLWKLGPLMGKSFSTDDSDQPHTEGHVYRYSIGVCGVPDANDIGDKSVTAAIQIDGEKKHVLGQLNDTAFMRGTDWMMLEYKNGDKYSSHCTQEERRTILMIICSPNDNEGHLKIIEENNNKESDCFYLFELSHSTACSDGQSGLSIGSIICIVVVCIAAVYLIGGFLYQRFVAGAKGLEQIPHIHFWRDFGNLQADGCDLLCRCGHQRSTRTYRGVGDDQLSSGHEETLHDHDDRDDHLLPM